MNSLGKCTVRVRISNFSWPVEMYIVNILNASFILEIPFIKSTQTILNVSDNECYFKFAKSTKVELRNNELDSPVCNNLQLSIGCESMRNTVEQIVTEFPRVFTDKVDQTLDLEIKLHVIDPTVVDIRPYFMSPPVLTKVKAILDDWLEQGIIRPSGSTYSSPCFLTKKGRLVVNFTCLKNKLQKFNSPIGDLQNYYHHLSSARYLTFVDLNKAFLQCGLAEESKNLTAFSTIYMGSYNLTDCLLV